MSASRDGQRRTALISLLIAFFFFQVKDKGKENIILVISNCICLTSSHITIIFSLSSPRSRSWLSVDSEQWRAGCPLPLPQRHARLCHGGKSLQNILRVQVMISTAMMVFKTFYWGHLQWWFWHLMTWIWKSFLGQERSCSCGTLRPSASSQVELDQHQNHSHSGPKWSLSYKLIIILVSIIKIPIICNV